ncbi:MAG: diphthine-ammonia ligase [Patescibacteria group bacterium]|jgi:diphthine-ammonia ligase
MQNQVLNLEDRFFNVVWACIFMRLGVLFSGGKDSCLATQKAIDAGHEIVCLLSMNSRNLHSYMFHTPSISAVSVQAKAAGVPLIIQKTDGVEEIEVDDLYSLISSGIEKYKIEGIVTGAVFSVYQGSRVQKVCSGLGVAVFNPLWLKSQEEILEEILSLGMKVVVDGVFADGLNASYLGREIDDTFIVDVRKLHDTLGIEIAGEGGEYETCCLWAPWFSSYCMIESFRDFSEGKYSYRRELILGVKDE